MESTVNERVKEVLRLNGISETQLSKLLNLSQSMINRQLKGENSLSCDLVNAILLHFNDISAEWLMRGEGEMLRTKRPLPVMNEYNKSDMDLIRELREDKKMLQDYVAHLANSVENLTTNKKEQPNN